MKSIKVIALILTLSTIALFALLFSSYSYADNKLTSLYENDLYIGNNNAKNVIIEYYSPLCGACKKFHYSIFNVLKKHFIDTGKIKYIIRFGAFSNMPNERIVNNFLFYENSKFTIKPSAEHIYKTLNAIFVLDDWKKEEAGMVTIASMLGISNYKSVIHNKKISAHVNDLIERTKNSGIKSYPTLLLNGKEFSIRDIFENAQDKQNIEENIINFFNSKIKE